MARIASIEIPDNKRIVIALTYVYGIGLHTAQELLRKTGISEDVRTKDLAPAELAKLRSAIESEHTVEGELRKVTMLSIKRLREIKCYRGVRHAKGLPVRGQRTKTNARTRKGKRKA